MISSQPQRASRGSTAVPEAPLARLGSVGRDSRSRHARLGALTVVGDGDAAANHPEAAEEERQRAGPSRGRWIRGARLDSRAARTLSLRPGRDVERVLVLARWA